MRENKDGSNQSVGITGTQRPAAELSSDFYERKLLEVFGSRVEALCDPVVQRAVELHFRAHPEQIHDAQQVVAVACQVKKSQVQERNGIRP